MYLKKINFKLFVAIIYLIILTTGLYYLFSVIDLTDLNDYEFYKSKQGLISNFKGTPGEKLFKSRNSNISSSKIFS